MGGGADVVRVEPQSVDSQFSLDEPRVHAFGVVRGAALLDVRVARWASAWATLAADLDPSAASYVVAGRGGEQLVLRPWTVRPAVLLGLVFP
jgi:hypothetical protein